MHAYFFHGKNGLCVVHTSYLEDDELSGAISEYNVCFTVLFFVLFVCFSVHIVFGFQLLSMLRLCREGCC